MKQTIVFLALLSLCTAALAIGPSSGSAPVFRLNLVPDRIPVVAGDELQLAVTVTINSGWHVSSDDPGDEFSLPTTVHFMLPEGWPAPVLTFPHGEELKFNFSDTPIEVWEHSAVILASLVVPSTADGAHALRVSVTGQACNNTQCLPPKEVRAGLDVTVVPPGSSSKPANKEIFEEIVARPSEPADSSGSSDLASKSLPLLLIGVFMAGLALNLTPCIFPLIPITIGIFTQQTKDREGSAFLLALAYVIGIAITYSVLGVLAALSGAIFGSALQSPWVVGLIAVVLLSLAASMFGLWEH